MSSYTFLKNIVFCVYLYVYMYVMRVRAAVTGVYNPSGQCAGLGSELSFVTTKAVTYSPSHGLGCSFSFYNSFHMCEYFPRVYMSMHWVWCRACGSQSSWW